MQLPPPIPAAFTVKGFCEAYSIGRTLAYEQIGAGRLKAKKVGNRTLILKADADLWANSLAELPSSNSS